MNSFSDSHEISDDYDRQTFSDKTLAHSFLRTHITCVDACVLTLIALMLNLFRNGSASIVLDEATSIRYARLNFVSLLPVIAGGDPNMSLYYILLNLWVRVFGHGEAAVRSLSAVFGALGVAAIYIIAAHFYGRSAGIVAGLMLMLNSLMIQYAQLARSYALLVTLVTLSCYLFALEIEQPSRRKRAAYLLVTVASVYAHYFSAWVIIAQLATALMVRSNASRRKQWLMTGAAILVLCAPEVFFAYRGGTERISWIEPASLSSISSVFVAFAGDNILLLVFLIASVLIAFAVRERRWPIGFFCAWLVIPIALTYVVSLKVPIFVSNYLLICLPSLILLSACGITGLPRITSRVVLVTIVVGMSVPQLITFYTREGGENWRDATRFVLAASLPGDAILFYPAWAHKPFDYYHQENRTPPVTITSPSLPRARIWFMIRESDAAAHPMELQQLRSSLLLGYRLRAQREFRRVGVELYVP